MFYRRNSDKEMRRLERDAARGDREAALRLVLGMKRRSGIELDAKDLYLLVQEIGLANAFTEDSVFRSIFESKWFDNQIESLYNRPLNEWVSDGDPARISGHHVGPVRWRQGEFQILFSAAFNENDEEDALGKFDELERYLSDYEMELQEISMPAEANNWSLDTTFTSGGDELDEDEDEDDDFDDDDDEEVECEVRGSKSLEPYHVLHILSRLGFNR